MYSSLPFTPKGPTGPSGPCGPCGRVKGREGKGKIYNKLFWIITYNSPKLQISIWNLE